MKLLCVQKYEEEETFTWSSFFLGKTEKRMMLSNFKIKI
jgi:hypothetical protein